MTPEALERYARHLVLKEIGGPGQQALSSSRVTIVGAGGLGGPAALYLAAAGVGHITLIDDDRVDLSNLQRQVQFSDADIGHQKATALAQRIAGINPEIDVDSRVTRLARDNARGLLGGSDIVLDGTDSFETRFAVNAACLALQTPLISGALGRFDGQIAIFPSDGSGPCYRCFVPEVPPQAETCAEVGVVGALAGVIGSLMALETIKLITGAGEPLLGKLLIYDGLKAQSRTVTLQRDPTCPACGA